MVPLLRVFFQIAPQVSGAARRASAGDANFVGKFIGGRGIAQDERRSSANVQSELVQAGRSQICPISQGHHQRCSPAKSVHVRFAESDISRAPIPKRLLFDASNREDSREHCSIFDSG
ncbi:unnamed protein product [Nesidiocoris tenuis]|nr:unnamed protein product [Nesidiocoris tenuis]